MGGGLEHRFPSRGSRTREGTDQHEERGAGEVEVGEEAVDDSEVFVEVG